MAQQSARQLSPARASIVRQFASLSGATDWLRISPEGSVQTTPGHILASIISSAAAPSADPPTLVEQLAADKHAQDYAESLKQKYQEKLRKRAESEGFDSVDAFMEAKKKEKLQRQEQEHRRLNEQIPPQPNEPQSSNKPSKKPSGPSYAKNLDQIVRLDLLQKQPADRIAAIWNQYHAAQPNALSGTVSPNVYNRLMERGRRYPHFLLPLPREKDDGYELFLMQMHGKQVYYTTLLEFKTRGPENATPALIVSHYDELAESKDLVLMTAEIDTYPQSASSSSESANPGASLAGRPKLTMSEAQNLIYQTQLFYVTGEDSVTQLVETFSEQPDKFDYQDLIRAIETLSPASSSKST